MKQAPVREFIIKAALKQRRAPPEAITNAPHVYPWLAIFQQAFFDLCGDRFSEGAPIPWSARQKWAEVHGLDAEATDLLHHHVRAQDLVFLRHIRQSNGSGTPESKPMPAQRRLRGREQRKNVDA